MIQDLSIVITTYNRRNRLITQLNSIFLQAYSKKLEIIILDNCSDYDIQATITDHFPDKMENITIKVRQYNAGAYWNVASAFTYCTTKWMWLLSDDDETMPNSLENIFCDIEEQPEVLMFKYTIPGLPVEEDVRVNDMDGYLDYYLSGHFTGGMFFMSNNIFNMERLRPNLGYANLYSYTFIPHVIPILKSLSVGLGDIQFSSKSIVNYKAPDKEYGGRYLLALGLGLSTIGDIDLGLSEIQYKRLLKIIVREFPMRQTLDALFQVPACQRLSLFRRLSISLFRYRCAKWKYCFPFYIRYFLGIDLFKWI